MLKIKRSITAVSLALLLGLLFSPAAMAVVTPDTGSPGGGGTSSNSSSSTDSAQAVYKNPDPCHPERDRPPGKALSTQQLKSCEACNNKENPTDGEVKNCLKQNPIVKDINTIVNALAGLVAVVCVAMIVLGGIKYSLARNNPQEIAAARSHIINAVFAMIAFMLLWSLLQFLVPGGVFNS